MNREVLRLQGVNVCLIRHQWPSSPCLSVSVSLDEPDQDTLQKNLVSHKETGFKDS